MSVNQFPKSSTTSDSNIPVPKRSSTGTKKAKRCAQLPELQKYIETIIKASNEFEPEDPSQSDKDKFPKERKFGGYSVYKGRESNVKPEKNKNQLNLSGSKNNIKAKTPISDAVSRGVKVFNTYAPEFEDPRNWKLGKTHSSGPNLEIEKFLKKFYPNPYHLESVNEFKQPDNDNKDELRDGTLPDVVISQANIHTEVDIEKRDNDFQTADNEPCKREKKCITPVSTTENQSTRRYHKNAKTVDGYNLKVPALSRKPSRVQSINSVSNGSSRASSAESMSDTISRDSLRKRKNLKSKSRPKAAKKDTHSDYDIGKLKLLSISDSEQSISMTYIDSPLRDVEISPELREEIYKTEDFNDLKEIYDIMYKATESFLQISSKNESSDYLRSLMESDLFCSKLKKDTIPELRNSESNKTPERINPSRTKLELTNSDKTEDEIYKTIEDKLDDDNTTAIEIKFEEREPTIEKSLLDVLLKDDNFEYTCNPEERKPDQVHNQEETVSNFEVVLLEEEGSRVDSPEEKKDFADTNEKTDEILDFMYGCLKKFNNKEKPPPEEGSKSIPEDEKPISCKRFRKEGVTDINFEKPTTSGSSRPTDLPWMYQDSANNPLTKAFPDIKEIKSKYSAALGEINRKSSRSRCKKRPAFTGSGSSSHYDIPLNGTSRPENPISQSPCYQHSAEAIGAGATIQTVESHNELGGFTEEPYGSITFNDECRTPKPLCPLSVKQKKSKTTSGKSLKDVLEAEEKLLSSEKIAKEAEEKQKSETASTTASQIEVQNETTKVYSHLGNFRQPSSNFVVCVNSFPRSMRNTTAVKPTSPLPVSTSLTDVKQDWSLKQMVVASKFPLKKHSLSLDEGCCVLQQTYSIKQEALLTMSKTVVAYTARPVSLKIITSFSKPLEEFSLKSSECLITMTDIPVEVPEEESTPSFQLTPVISTEDDKPVKALIEAIEETEEKLYLLEQSSAENLYSRNSELYSLSASETLKNELSENEVEKVNDRHKVHQLLQRTYNLQQKLHRYLQRMTPDQPTSTSCPLMQQEKVLDFNIPKNTKIEFDIKSESSLPVVHWHMKRPDIDEVEKADESVAVSVLMVDNSTSYDPPLEGKCDSSESSNQEKSEKGNDEDIVNNEDDRSSNYSFKSSNEYSEQSENKPKKDFDDLDFMDNKKLFQKICNEIESFRQSFEAEKLEKLQQQQQQQQQGEPVEKDQEEPTDRRLAHYDPKTPAKVLRTVFTGKKSSTELTLGLKDVPMTKVGNISVEKTKFSPNHTKISVAFTKEHTGERINKFSSYMFDQMRSSLSTCITEYSELKDDVSKSSQSLNGDSDNSEDDYKSVGSTMGNSDLDADEEKPEPKEQKPVESSASKSYTKHRFDFYRKMTPDLGPAKAKPKPLISPVCKYKELEPLKQALTDMQIRMRNIRRDAIFNSNDYYERALKLAKMSAGFCQSCGNRAVIPNDTFGYYRTLLPRRSTHHRRNRHFRPTLTTNPSFYSLHSGNVDVGDQFCELGIKHSSYMLNPRLHSNRTVLRSSLHDMPILFERM